jgi:hypothetical protein
MIEPKSWFLIKEAKWARPCNKLDKYICKSSWWLNEDEKVKNSVNRYILEYWTLEIFIVIDKCIDFCLLIVINYLTFITYNDQKIRQYIATILIQNSNRNDSGII